MPREILFGLEPAFFTPPARVFSMAERILVERLAASLTSQHSFSTFC
jgi:hypothetical protein